MESDFQRYEGYLCALVNGLTKRIGILQKNKKEIDHLKPKRRALATSSANNFSNYKCFVVILLII